MSERQEPINATGHSTADEPEFIDITGWVRALSDELSAIDAAFSAVDPDDKESRYGGYMLALATVSRGLKRLPGFDAQMVVLRDLAFRLEAVTQGNNVLAPPAREGKNGRPPEGLDRAITKAQAVAAIELMIKSGIAESEAIEFATGVLRKRKVVGRAGKLVKSDTVGDWRYKILNPKDDDNTDARDHFLYSMSLAHRLAPNGVPPQHAKALARVLIESV